VADDMAWVKIDKQTENYARFIVSPLRKGFGNTLGNSLRRVLLAYLSGSAITAVKIDGVVHEFTTLDSLKEDILDIIMNLKEVVFKIHENSDGAKIAKINVKKEGIVTAADIETGSDVEIINKDHYLAMLEKGGKLDIEITINTGIGYSPASSQNKKDFTIGTIPIDAVFTPVLKVNHKVEDFRVGEKIDYDKLTLEVWTNGSLSPQEAVSKSAEILQKELTIFNNIGESNKQKDKKTLLPPLQKADKKKQTGLGLTIVDLELSARSYNCLRKAGIEKVAELLEKDIKDLMKIKNFGIKSADEINEKLRQYNLSLKGTIEDNEEKKK